MHVDGEGSQPDVDLTKPDLQSFLELGEELPNLGAVRHIDKGAYQFIAK